MRLLLIANPVSGGDARPRIIRAAAWLQAQGAAVELQLTGRRGDARRLAAEARGRCDRVVVAGGDGTLNEVINGLAPSPIPVAFLPLGTTNVFALEAGIPRDLDQACRVALQGTPRPVCLGRAGDERFLLMAGVGFDAAVVHRVDLAWKRKAGKLAYLASALSTLRKMPLADFEVIGDDGLVRRACQVVAGNARYYGGRFSLTPTASLFAERLDVCLVRPMGKVSFLISALFLAAGLTPRGVERFTTRALALRGAPVPLQLDGDPQGSLPRTLTVTVGEIVLILPI